MEKQKYKETEVIFKEEDGMLLMEVKLSKKLEKEMKEQVSELAGAIPISSK